MPKLTTIAIKPETREKLKRFGMKGESYDEVINRLMRERTMEVALPREPGTLEEVERLLEEGDYVTAAELRKRLGL